MSMKSLSVNHSDNTQFSVIHFCALCIAICEAYFANWISEHFVCIVISNRFVTFLKQHHIIQLKTVNKIKIYILILKNTISPSIKIRKNIYIQLLISSKKNFLSPIADRNFFQMYVLHFANLWRKLERYDEDIYMFLHQ